MPSVVGRTPQNPVAQGVQVPRRGRHAFCKKGSPQNLTPTPSQTAQRDGRLLSGALLYANSVEEITMQLSFWIPVMLLLGLASHALLFVFIKICDEV